MGASVSNMFDFKSREKEEYNNDESNRKSSYEVDPGPGNVDDSLIAEESDKQRVQWWQHILFAKGARIGYVFVIGVLLGIIIPAIIFAATLDNSNKLVYGSCLIKNYARFECLANSAQEVTQKMCQEALCCWENSESLPFKCYHSLPSAYQYNIGESARKPDGVDLTLIPNAKREDSLSKLQVSVRWNTDDHLVLEISNMDVFKNSLSVNETSTSNTTAEEKPFDISWAEGDDELFYLRIARRDSNETIFDTRLGPVYATGSDITLSTLLPTKYFYGLKGGQGSVRTEKFGIVNGFENSEFPFYTAFEASGNWHGVYVDTAESILVQVLQAPGLMFYLETDEPKITLNFFSGPDPQRIMQQLHTYTQTKYNISTQPMIPEYWGLGLHLCRRMENSSVVYEDILDLTNNINKSIVYESDCIDEYLRHPIHFNGPRFDEPNITEIIAQLDRTSKKIVLSQKSSVLHGGNEEHFKNHLVQTSDSTRRQAYVGHVDNVAVKYIDPFPVDILQLSFLEDPFTVSSEPNKTNVYGFSLDDNFPLSYRPNGKCNAKDSRLKGYYTKADSTSDAIKSSSIWGSLCPDEASHGVSNRYVNHMHLHNQYGEQYLKTIHQQFYKTASPPLLTSGSFWTTSRYYGGYHGMHVPFTWQGLQESVKNIVRNYAMAPVSGTPICGGILPSNITLEKDNELCLRWFQFGLLLPIARNSYNGNSSFGPKHLPDQYQRYLNQSIKTRYSLAPYYYTELLKYQNTLVPVIRPMSFDFYGVRERDFTLPLTDQFMIGTGMFAAPIIERGVTRSAYFPAGTWYAMDGQQVWSNMANGAQRQVAGFITDTPTFVRGGHIIPTIRNSDVNSIEDTIKKGENYTLMVGFTSTEDGQAWGDLAVKEFINDGTHTLNLVNFSANVTNSNTDTVMQLVVSLNGTCGNGSKSYSSTIDQIKFLGMTGSSNANVVVHYNGEPSEASCGCDPDEKYLEINNLDLDWCECNLSDCIVTINLTI